MHKYILSHGCLPYVRSRLDDWLNLVSVPINLDRNKDRFLWQLRKNGDFSTQSLYREIMKNELFCAKKLFSKGKLPLKIKIFL